jgi:hypothetical protein
MSVSEKIVISLSDEEVKKMAPLKEKLMNRKIKKKSKKSEKQEYKIDNEVPYGNLKNGIKPTFSEWKSNGNGTSKSRYTGTGKVDDNIYVFIPNESTRKRYNKKNRAKTIRDMKRMLIRNNLMRSKSNAPDEIIKCMYDNTVSFGTAENTNEKMVLFNYLNDV